MADLTMLTGQRVTATLVFDNPPADVPVWNTPFTGTLTVAADGLSADFVSGDAPTAGVMLTASASGLTVSKTVDINARSVVPTTIDMTFSTPVDA